ncbi:DUF2470 domain-containing protein [Microbacterium sp. A82]|uniref:DUF2470 domain-containing protein n=1 Tax=unclassified Microbacterium TaxID=2609290 RepID=UPI003F36257D
MPHIFEDDVVSAVLHHMNNDHAADNLLISQANAAASDLKITSAEMIDFTGTGGIWQIVRAGIPEQLDIPWLGGSITERADVRREIVALYDQACARLGVAARPHD